MEIDNIYVVYGKPYTRDKVIDEIKAEGYTHNFFFGDNKEYDDKIKNIHYASEIWVFGDVKRHEDYIYALKNKFDIWRMG